MTKKKISASNSKMTTTEDKNIQEKDLCEKFEEDFIDYAMSVILDRALPDIRDGLKPSQRRSLFAMYMLKLFDKKTKEARVVGECIGKLHPHGDTSIKECIDRMAKDWIMRQPLVDFMGNIGNPSGSPAAAQRYLEVKLSSIGGSMLTLLNKKVVDMQPNFSEDMEEPIVLPSRFCNLLVNGCKGIAVGMASNIPTHNLIEVCDANIAYLKNKDITIEELMKYIPAPDFPLGGTIINKDDMLELYSSGKGKVILRVEPIINKDQIVFDSIPFGTNVSTIVSKIIDLATEEIIPEIEDVNDFSGFDKEENKQILRIEISLRKNSNAEEVLKKLYELTPLQSQLNFNMTAIVDRKPVVLDLKEFFVYYSEFLENIHRNALNFDLEKERHKLLILEGYALALAHIDEVINIIKTSSDNSTALEKLKELLVVNDEQAKAILDLKLSRLTKLEVNKITEEVNNSKAIVKKLEDTLLPENFINFVIEDLEKIKKFGNPRRTKLDNIELPKKRKRNEITVKEEDFYVVCNNDNLMKKDYKKGDFKINSLDFIYCFTSQGNLIKFQASKLSENYERIEQLDYNDSILSSGILRENDLVIMITKDGYVKTSKAEEFLTIKGKNVKSIKFKDPEDYLIAVISIPEKSKTSITAKTSMNKEHEIILNDLSATKRVTMGRKLIPLEEKELIEELKIK